MIKIRKSEDRGLTKLDWLTSYHSFSFNNYYNPEYVHFGPLRVLNDDIVQPGEGFGKHPHQNMEIVTYVLSGALEHEDSTGTKEVIHAGEIQRMTAGTGVFHSEYNHSDSEKVHLLQIWFLPDKDGYPPSYEQKKFTGDERKNKLLLVASNKIDSVGVFINQDVNMYTSNLEPGKEIDYKIGPNRGLYLFLVSGELNVNGSKLQNGDAYMIDEECDIKIKSIYNSELVLFDLTMNI